MYASCYRMNIMSLVYIILVLLVGHGTAELLQIATGEVGRGNFTYFQLMLPGFYSLELESPTGDCDLYVSQNIAKPTFEPESYCLQSATCGLDSVVIPKSFKRPVGIGIFGHPLFDSSSYILVVREITGISEVDEFMDELSLVGGTQIGGDSFTARSINHSEEDGQQEEDSFLWVVLWSIVDLILEILFL